MKALTVRQPWAELIMSGRKRFETRSWSTTHRGPLIIHAGATPAPSDLSVALTPSGVMHLGAGLGWVELIDVHPIPPHDGGDEVELGDYTPGRYAWELANPVRWFAPIPMRGKLGLWEWQGIEL